MVEGSRRPAEKPALELPIVTAAESTLAWMVTVFSSGHAQAIARPMARARSARRSSSWVRVLR